MSKAFLPFRTSARAAVAMFLLLGCFSFLQAQTANPATGITTVDFTASWTANGSATGYKLDVATDNQFNTFVAGYNGLDVGANLSSSVTGLTPGTNYYYRVTAYDGGGDINTSGIVSLTTVPVPPVLNLAGSITANSFTGSWFLPVGGAAGYRLDVSTDVNFGSFVTGYEDLDLGNVYSFTVNTNLSPGTYYYYRLRAYTSGGTSISSGSIGLNTLLAIPTANAAASITATSFSASWSAVTNATGYRLDVATDNSFTTFVSGYQDVDVNNVTSYTVNTNLTAGTNYWYRVRAYNAFTASLYSTDITLITVPDAPIATAATAIGTAAFSANWNATTGAAGYRLDVATDNLFTSPVAGYNNLDVTNVTTYVVNSGLSSGTNYFYRVRAYDASGTGLSSGTISLTTIAAAPTANAATAITTNSFSASWSSPTGTTGFKLDVATDNLFASYVSGYQDLDVGNATTYSVNTNLNPGINYFYRVRAYNGGGTSLSSGTISLFTVPAAPTANAAGAISSNSFTASWSASTGATGYRLDVATDNTFSTFVSGYQNLDVTNVTTYAVNTNLTPGTDYWYRVRAYNTGGTSVNSNDVTLITISAAPVATAGTTITRYSFSANWNASTGAAGYYLDAAKDSTFTVFLSGLQNHDVGNVTTFTVNSLVPGYPYFYRVRAYNASGTSSNSDTIKVTTLPPSADLAITSTVDNATPKNLDVLTYHFTITNNGPDTAKAVILHASIPRGFKYGSSNAVSSTYDPNTGIWNVGTLVMGSSASLTVIDTVDYFNQAYDFRSFYDFNVFTKHDATLVGANVGGKIAVGHDMTVTGSADIGGQLRARPTIPDVVVVGHDLNFPSGVVHNGNVAYGNTTNLPVGSVSYPNGSLVHSSPIDFASQGAYLNGLSSALDGYDVNGTTTVSGGAVTLTGTDIYLNVFTVSGAQFQAASNFSVIVPNGSVAVVNVGGSTLQTTGSAVDLNNNLDNFVLFNFPHATNLNIIGASIDGTVLAPFATVKATGSLFRGQLFSNDLTSFTAAQNHGFVGYIPLNRTISFTPLVVSSFSTDPVSGNNVVPATVVINTTAPYGHAGNGTWTVASVLPVNEMVLSMTRLDANTVLAGTNLGKIYRVDNNGVLGNVINASMTPVAYIHQLAVNDSGHIFAATESGLYRSNDAGATWTTFLVGKEVRAILFGSGGYVYAGTWSFGIYRSSDRGYNWTQKNDNLSSTVIHALLDRTKNAPQYTVFAGTFGKGVAATYDFANTWMDMAVPYDFITCMNKSSDGILFVGTLTDGVYRSYDNGNTWAHMDGLPAGPIYAIRVDGSDNIFVSSWLFGIYGSADLGVSWNYLGLGGFGVSTTYPGPNGSLFASSSTGKLFKNNSPLTGIKDTRKLIPTKFALQQNYPNPFNPATSIRFELPTSEKVTLKIFDVLGKEVVTLINSEVRDAGFYTVNFNAANLSSGIYLYRIEAGKNVMSKKMILLK